MTQPTTTYDQLTVQHLFTAQPGAFRVEPGHWAIVGIVIVGFLVIGLLPIVLILPYSFWFSSRKRAWRELEISAGRTLIIGSLLKGWTSSDPKTAGAQAQPETVPATSSEAAAEEQLPGLEPAMAATAAAPQQANSTGAPAADSPVPQESAPEAPLQQPSAETTQHPPAGHAPQNAAPPQVQEAAASAPSQPAAASTQGQAATSSSTSPLWMRKRATQSGKRRTIFLVCIAGVVLFLAIIVAGTGPSYEEQLAASAAPLVDDIVADMTNPGFAEEFPDSLGIILHGKTAAGDYVGEAQLQGGYTMPVLVVPDGDFVEVYIDESDLAEVLAQMMVRAQAMEEGAPEAINARLADEFPGLEESPKTLYATLGAIVPNHPHYAYEVYTTFYGVRERLTFVIHETDTGFVAEIPEWTREYLHKHINQQ